ncbi:uncharacterized protein PAC_20138 [Phialocephala subalpina]|uniref:Rhodopsin domain-containing protein n=1 Tax=Phialocephala subalpina TaxID=576137 RepID=A0A1L7XYY7_9HELO|nr:uncharacterized protein PAC_20138 [Phialocephala subalpina]
MGEDSRKTIIMVTVFGFCGAFLMLSRLAMRKVRRQKFNLSDYLTMVALACLASRTGFTTVVVLWGNNNLTDTYRAWNEFTALEIHQREVGSKLTLVNRINYNTYIWIQKAIVLLLYRRMLDGLPQPHHIMNFYWGFLASTYIVVQSVTFVECHPFYLYWQVMPPPGKCPKALVQLIVFVTLNIVTDILLIILPMPWLIRMKASLKQRLSLVGLFSIGFLLIAVAIARLPIYGNGTSQVNRNTWGSIEEFAAAFVANVPTLFALRHRPATADNTSFCNRRHSDMTELRKRADEGIMVTHCIELQRDTIKDSKDPEGFEVVCFEEV